MQLRRMIVVAGPPGAGKSTFATTLSRTLGSNAIHFSSDEVGLAVREAMGNTGSLSSTDYLHAARGALLLFWRKSLLAGTTCIHDAAVPGIDTWHALFAIARDTSAVVDVACLDAPDEALWARVLSRTSNQLVAHSHASVSEEAARARSTYSQVERLQIARSFVRLESASLGPEALVAVFQDQVLGGRHDTGWA